MTTLHIFRSEPDEQVRELIQAITPGEIRLVVLYDEVVDYDQLVSAIFTHDRIVSWWWLSGNAITG
jgi:hypothetical protein